MILFAEFSRLMIDDSSYSDDYALNWDLNTKSRTCSSSNHNFNLESAIPPNTDGPYLALGTCYSNVELFIITRPSRFELFKRNWRVLYVEIMLICFSKIRRCWALVTICKQKGSIHRSWSLLFPPQSLTIRINSCCWIYFFGIKTRPLYSYYQCRMILYEYFRALFLNRF